MDDVKLELKASEFAKRFIDDNSALKNPIAAETLARLSYIAGYRAGELEATARRTTTEETT